MSDLDSSDSEFLLQAFPIPPSDTNDPPNLEKALTSPEEFIKYVRFEASSYPNVIHSGVGLSAPTEVTTRESTNFYSHPSETLPQSDESLLSNFDSMVEEYRAVKILLSRLKHDETRKIKSAIGGDLLEKPPSLLWIAHLSRSELGELAELVSSHCTKRRWKPDIVVWIFALLVALEPPFHPDVCFSLRTIARRCQSLKNCLAPCRRLAIEATQQESSAIQDHSVEPQFFDIFLHLVARRFGQLDLLVK